MIFYYNSFFVSDASIFFIYLQISDGVLFASKLNSIFLLHGSCGSCSLNVCGIDIFGLKYG